MRTILLTLMIFGIAAPAAYAELREIDSLTCHMLPGECISKDGKFYMDWTATDQAAVDKHQTEYDQSAELWGQAHAGGWTPTASNCGLFSTETMKILPGTDALFKKYGLGGYCGNDGPYRVISDCYVARVCMERAAQKKFAHIKDPVKRLDAAIEDKFAFDMWFHAQPRVESKKLYDSYPTWKNPASVRTGGQLCTWPNILDAGNSINEQRYKELCFWKNPTGTAAGSTAGTAPKIEPAGGAFRPFKPVSSGSTKKKTDEEPPAFVIGGKYTD